MNNFIPGTCGTDPCSSETCGDDLSSPLCHPDLAMLPQVPSMRLIGVLGECLVTMNCSATGFLVSTGNGIEISKGPCVELPWERNVLVENGNVVLGDDNLPVEDQPPSVLGIVVEDDNGCLRKYRGASNVRQKLISNNSEVSWVDDPIPVTEEEEQSFCTNTTCELFVVPGGGPYTLSVAESGFFVINEGVVVGELLFVVNSKPAAGVLVVTPARPVTENKTIAAGSLACFSVVAYNCDSTPEYDSEPDGEITSVKICTEDGGDRLLLPVAGKHLVGVEREGGDVFWELQDIAAVQTGRLFFPVTKQYKQVSADDRVNILIESTISFDLVPAAEIPAVLPGRDVYMVINLYSLLQFSTLRNYFVNIYDSAGANMSDLVMQHRSTNTSSNYKGSYESTQAIVKCHNQADLRSLRLWHQYGGHGSIEGTFNANFSAQIVGYYQ